MIELFKHSVHAADTLQAECSPFVYLFINMDVNSLFLNLCCFNMNIWMEFGQGGLSGSQLVLSIKNHCIERFKEEESRRLTSFSVFSCVF